MARDLSHAWRKETRQVYARFAGNDPDAPPVRLPDGGVDTPAPFDPQRRTYRQLTRSRLMLCPMEECQPFYKLSQGPQKVSHFSHEERPHDGLHRGGPESIWHKQAKCTVYDWLAATLDPADITDLQFEYQHLPALRDGRRRRPDVYLELNNGVRVAFECQQQSMAGTDDHDYAAIWQRRVADYTELRDSIGLRVVWFVSPWATIAKPQFDGHNVWKCEASASYGSQMIKNGETVYWIDPTFEQIGTMTEHVAKPRDVDLPRGYLKHAKQFHRNQWYWLHSDNIISCDIDPHTGTVTTPTDRRIHTDQWLADRHTELLAAQITAAQQARAEQAARQELVAQQKRDRIQQEQDAAARRREEDRREQQAEAAARSAAAAAAAAAQSDREFAINVAIFVAMLVLAVLMLAAWLLWL